MKKIISSLYIAGFLLLISCGSNKSDSDKLNTETSKQTSATSNPASTPNNLSIQNVQDTQSKALIPPAKANTGNVKLNPAHGEPGHRCEIAVGAPLSSAPAQTTTQPNTAQPNTIVVDGKGLPQKISVPSVTEKPAAPAVASGSGLNPAHGQPGHRCEIAVGAPLPKQ